ncbi:MAG TPA: hypothetical protein VHL77_08880, partial [Ferruginibacter sp.]|nr:hypothetical protein [Ferruginibacter sp.]
MHKILFLLSLLCVQYTGFCLRVSPDFTAVFDSKKNAVQIRWQHEHDGIRTYVVQRSVDKNSWADIAVQGIQQNSTANSFYLEDKQPKPGENYYRLKTISYTGEVKYSLEVMIIIPQAGAGWTMYPVPVTDMLTLDYHGTEPIKGVINVFLLQSSGRVLTKM